MSGIVNFNYLQLTSVLKANDTTYSLNTLHDYQHSDALLLLFVHQGQLLIDTTTRINLNPGELIVLPCHESVAVAASVPETQVLTVIFQATGAQLTDILGHVMLVHDTHLPMAIRQTLATIIDLRQRKPNQAFDQIIGQAFMIACSQLYADLTRLLLQLADQLVLRQLPAALLPKTSPATVKPLRPQLAEARTHGNGYKQLLVNQIIAYMHTHLGARLTISGLANEFLIGEANLKKQFKQVTGVSVIKYFDQLRLQQAITLVAQHELTYTQIANQLGFSSSHHFSTAFKRYTGASPSQYYASLNS
ncbi:AraC family transcriptional regulator [Lacticaseibacillus sp. GG6-2]